MIEKRMKVKIKFIFLLVFLMTEISVFSQKNNLDKPRVIVTSDGEIDDQCSMVRFLLYSNEWDIRAIITSSSQYHWQGHKWAGDDWVNPFLEAYSNVYPNLLKHDKSYPAPEYLKSVTFIGNVKSEGEMDLITQGSNRIVEVLLDESDDRPIWIQAWGGTNTLARALKTIEEDHPEKMQKVAQKLHFFLIWEQDSTYQSYIKPKWGKFKIQTIICDQFWAFAYQWDKIIPEEKQQYFRSEWMTSNILQDHGPLCSLYQACKGGSDKEGFIAGDPKNKGDFRSEGDSPAFIYTIATGLRSMESPDYGGWGGRYIKVRDNTWLDSVPEPNYKYPEGRWYTNTGWGRQYMKLKYPANPELMKAYFDPTTRWVDAVQNDFAARADWCVKSYKEANHAPVVRLKSALDVKAGQGIKVDLNAGDTFDPDGNKLAYRWWQYNEAGTYSGNISIKNASKKKASFIVPSNAEKGQTIHVICEVKDNGIPALTSYQRVIITVY